MHNPATYPEETSFDDPANARAALHEKLADTETPGFQAELDPDEAECAGAFVEDALSEAAALQSVFD